MVVEDDPHLCDILVAFIKKCDYGACGAYTGQEASELFKRIRPDLVILDLKLPDSDGLQLLQKFKRSDPHCKVVILSTYSGTDTVVEAMKLGAENYLTKPTPLPELRLLIDTLLDVPSQDAPPPAEIEGVIGSSTAMQDVYRMVRKVAATSVTVLIRGESGTGKEVIARAIHMLSPFSDKSFIAVDCTNIPGSLMESELFGHERGAFTDAKAQKKGLVEIADGGTILFDEIGLLPIDLQSKLLNVLETMRFRRVGGTEEISVSVRFIAATNEDLEARVQEGQFREDLYYRLNVVPIRLPPLRERDEDVLLIAEHYLDFFSSLHGTVPRRLADDAKSLLRSYALPGNVRELRNVMERAVVIGERPIVHAEDLPIDRRKRLAAEKFSIAEDGSVTIAFPSAGIPLEEIERQVVTAALEHTEGNVTRAANLLHVSRDKIRYRMAKYQLNGNEE